MQQRRPRLAYPFTVLTQPGVVRLVAGEDHRYSLSGAGLDDWLPELLANLRGETPVVDLLAGLPDERRGSARQIIERLYGERVLVDGPAAAAHRGAHYRIAVAGHGQLFERLRAQTGSPAGPRLHAFVQPNLDYAAAGEACRRARAANEPFLWASHGALDRAYVSPLLLPDAGPCFICLLTAFRRLSPAPEIYDALIEHGRQARPFADVELADGVLDVLHGLATWKLTQAELDQPPASLYRLHVLEQPTLEVSAHQVFVDPECPECRGGRGR